MRQRISDPVEHAHAECAGDCRVTDIHSRGILTEDGHDVAAPYLVERGEASVAIRDTPASKCEAGDIVGEIACLTRVPACATVNASANRGASPSIANRCVC